MNTFSRESSRPVAIWMYAGVVMLLIQIILGGITRLTGSGLSITEWNVVTGAMPPLNAAQWLNEFNRYRQTPQYHLLNSDFNLSDFKFIFFWEWFHRLWARLIGFAFLIPFIYFLVKKKFQQDMIVPLVVLFLLGALQGAVGWIMVASGLTGDAVYVRPTRLALHFVFALGLISYAFWFALQLSVPRQQIIKNSSLRQWSLAIICLLVFQLIYGALMAGHKAAAAAPTWPTINGEWLPAGMNRFQPLTINFIENKILIHFIHRSLAYLLVIVTFIWTVKAFRTRAVSSYFRKFRILPIVLIILQVLLGVLAVLSSTSIIPNRWQGFEWIAALHQVNGMLFLLSMVYSLYIIRPAESYI
jgi:cytochrome c oxidase assembly protein subunit 15